MGLERQGARRRFTGEEFAPAGRNGHLLFLLRVIDQKQDQSARGAFTKTLKAWQLLGKKPKMLWPSHWCATLAHR